MTIDSSTLLTVLDEIVFDKEETTLSQVIDTLANETLSQSVQNYLDTIQKIQMLDSARTTPVSNGSSSTLSDENSLVKSQARKIGILIATVNLFDTGKIPHTPRTVNHLFRIYQHLDKTFAHAHASHLQKIAAKIFQLAQWVIYNESVGGEFGQKILAHHETLKPILDRLTNCTKRDIAQVHYNVEVGGFCYDTEELIRETPPLTDRFLAAICVNLLTFLNHTITTEAQAILASIPAPVLPIDDCLGLIADTL